MAKATRQGQELEQMNDREQIFADIKSALGKLPTRTPYPEWNPAITLASAARNISDVVSLFRSQFSAVGGVCVDGFGGMKAWLVEQELTRGYVDSQLLAAASEHLSAWRCDSRIVREDIDAYAFGITPASHAIAETGTVVLRDADTPYRLGALAPWVHIAVVRKEDILLSVAEAINVLGKDPSIVFVTGPSKTADIEGIMIQGVHGPGIQVCCIV